MELYGTHNVCFAISLDSMSFHYCLTQMRWSHRDMVCGCTCVVEALKVKKSWRKGRSASSNWSWRVGDQLSKTFWPCSWFDGNFSVERKFGLRGMPGKIVCCTNAEMTNVGWPSTPTSSIEQLLSGKCVTRLSSITAKIKQWAVKSDKLLKSNKTRETKTCELTIFIFVVSFSAWHHTTFSLTSA